MPTADMQRRAQKLAMQASRLADQAGPMTRKAKTTARQGAGSAANWARPRVGHARTWLAVRAARGSVSVQDSIAPRISSMLAATARRLDPPRQSAQRRWPKLMAGTALLAAGAAAAMAMAMRGRQRSVPPPMPPRPPARGGQPSTVLNPSAEAERAGQESEVNGLSRTR
ncbi:MAG TPA: hypothetical protein VF834_20255 [Streptosporangiaceae bacterium]